MGALVKIVTAGLINAALAIIGQLFTQAFFEDVLKRVVIRGLDKLAAMTTNSLDDEIAQEVRRRLERKGEPDAPAS